MERFAVKVHDLGSGPADTAGDVPQIMGLARAAGLLPWGDADSMVVFQTNFV